MSWVERSLSFRLFDTLSRLLPPAWRRRLGGSKLLAPLRNALLRPGGKRAIAAAEVSFGERRFFFSGPFHAVERAKNRGIERKLSRLLASEVEPGSICVDVGAHCGWLSLQMAFATGPEGRVIAYEVDPEIVPHLETNLRRNGLDAYCRARAAHVGAEERSGREPDSGPATLTLDADLPRLGIDRIDVLKVDVDGGDLDVLRGARGLLVACHPLVIVELSEEPEEILELLVGVGYRHFYGTDSRPWPPGEAWPENLIAAPGSLA